VEAVLNDQAARERGDPDSIRAPRAQEAAGGGAHLIESIEGRRAMRRSARPGWHSGLSIAADHGDDGANLRHGAGLGPNLKQRTGRDGLHLDSYLVGFDLEEIVALIDLVAGIFEPGKNFALGDGLAQLRHYHIHML